MQSNKSLTFHIKKPYPIERWFETLSISSAVQLYYTKWMATHYDAIKFDKVLDEEKNG